MNIVSITKPLAVKGDFVLLPRKEYEVLKRMQTHLPPNDVEEVSMTSTQRKALLRARKALKEGKLLTFDEFSRKLGFKSRA